MATKIVTAESLQAVLQLIATDIKAKADSSHVHSDYVTTTAFNQAISNINSFNVLVVDSLPTENIDSHTIYLVSKTAETNDVYDEYLYINNEWEHIGNTKVDLSDYVTTNTLNIELNKKANSTHTHTKSEITDLTEYTLPTASSTQLGGVKVGSGLAINNGVLSATGGGTADSVDWSNVQNKPTKLSEFTNDSGFVTSIHTHSISDVTDLQTALNGKAPTNHTHVISDTSGLQTALDGKSPTTHNHDDVYVKSTDIEFSQASEASTMWNNAKA